MSVNPFVSVCIPTYNGGQYLVSCLESVLSQTYDNFEILIVDDQSTDQTIEIAEEYSKQYSCVRVVKNCKNFGLVGNWNRCIKLAKGDWIKFVFQDDLIESKCLQNLVEAVDGRSRLVVCWRNFIFEPGVDLETKKIYGNCLSLLGLFGDKQYISKEKLAMTALSSYRNFIGEPTSTLIHSSVFKVYGEFNPNFVQLCDLEFWLRVGLNEGIVVVPKYLVDFRVHATSVSAMNRKDNVFRSAELERLLMLHEYAFNPFYSSIREVALDSVPSRDLSREFAKKAYWLKNYARSDSNSEFVDSKYELWKSLSMLYPRFEKNIHIYPLKIRGWIENKVLWRFRK